VESSAFSAQQDLVQLFNSRLVSFILCRFYVPLEDAVAHLSDPPFIHEAVSHVAIQPLSAPLLEFFRYLVEYRLGLLVQLLGGFRTVSFLLADLSLYPRRKLTAVWYFCYLLVE